MKKNKNGSFFVGVTVSSELFEEMERARITERGRLSRNEFIRHAVVEQIKRTKKEASV